ncbi:MAG: class I SAM-dependent methyltransferase [Chloroflexota bacterium]
MTARDAFRAMSILMVLQGLALAVGGRRAIQGLEKVAPQWFQLWLSPLARQSPIVPRAIGLAEVILGLRLVAMAPPSPGLPRRLASIALEPVNALWQATVARQAERDFDQLLRQYVPPGARVLDLACGAGDNLARLLDADLPFGSYVGVDCSATLLAQARARFDGLPKIAFLLNDLLNDQLPPGEVDLILSTWSLDRVPDPFALIVRAMRQLRQDGHAMLLFASPPSSSPSAFASVIAKLLGRQLHPASLYDGLPTFTAAQTYAGGLASLVILENPPPVPAPVGASPPEERQP